MASLENRLLLLSKRAEGIIFFAGISADIFLLPKEKISQHDYEAYEEYTVYSCEKMKNDLIHIKLLDEKLRQEIEVALGLRNAVFDHRRDAKKS